MTAPRPIFLSLLLALLVACGASEDSVSRRNDMPTPPDFPEIPASLKEQLAFTCAYEQGRIPRRDPEADQLFLRARWMQKNNLLKEDPTVYPKVERLYRIAAAWGHDKAMNNLVLMLMRGQSDADDTIDLPVALAQDMIQKGIPSGYYNMGSLLNYGYGVEQDEKVALKYLRKAADLGNPEAQYYVGDKLTSLSISHPVPYKIGHEMIQCAADQGHAEAAISTAIHLKNYAQYGKDLITDKAYTPKEIAQNYADAVKYFQIAVKAGSSLAAYSLKDSFLGPPPDDQLDYLALEKDEERSRRYNKISTILRGYDY
jgi:TPR repeat protein